MRAVIMLGQRHLSDGAAAMTAGRISYPVACRGPMGTIKGEWRGVYGSRSFDLNGKMSFGPMTLTGTLTGRHAGDCTAK